MKILAGPTQLEGPLPAKVCRPGQQIFAPVDNALSGPDYCDQKAARIKIRIFLFLHGSRTNIPQRTETK